MLMKAYRATVAAGNKIVNLFITLEMRKVKKAERSKQIAKEMLERTKKVVREVVEESENCTKAASGRIKEANGLLK